MKIVAVNVSKTYLNADGRSCAGYVIKPGRLPEGPWDFDYITLLHYPADYLIAIDHECADSIGGCYKVVGNVYEDLKQGVGTLFPLAKCSPEEEKIIRDYLKGTDLSGFSHKKLW